jgi:hypothetical protein
MFLLVGYLVMRWVVIEGVCSPLVHGWKWVRGRWEVPVCVCAYGLRGWDVGRGHVGGVGLCLLNILTD